MKLGTSNMCPNCIRGLVIGTNEVCGDCGGTGVTQEIVPVVKKEKVVEKKEVKKGKK